MKTTEYHGWIILATSKEDWSDGDFADAFDRVKDLLCGLLPDEGHDPVMPSSELLPRMVYLKGFDVESPEPVLLLIEKIGRVFDKAYGELAVSSSTGGDWGSDGITRYSVLEGKYEEERF